MSALKPSARCPGVDALQVRLTGTSRRRGAATAKNSLVGPSQRGCPSSKELGHSFSSCLALPLLGGPTSSLTCAGFLDGQQSQPPVPLMATVSASERCRGFMSLPYSGGCARKLRRMCTESFVFVHAEPLTPGSRGLRQISVMHWVWVLVPPEFDESGPAWVSGDDGDFVAGLFQFVLDFR